MNIMALLEQATLIADRGSPLQAVALILDAQTPDAPALAAVIEGISEWDPVLVASFTRHDRQYLCDGKFGRFWLTPRRNKRRALPPAPVVVMAELYALAQAVVAAAHDEAA